MLYTHIKPGLLSLKIAKYIIRICNQENRYFIENETIYIYIYITSYLIICSLIIIPIIVSRVVIALTRHPSTLPTHLLFCFYKK